MQTLSQLTFKMQKYNHFHYGFPTPTTLTTGQSLSNCRKKEEEKNSPIELQHPQTCHNSLSAEIKKSCSNHANNLKRVSLQRHNQLQQSSGKVSESRHTCSVGMSMTSVFFLTALCGLCNVPAVVRKDKIGG